MTLFQFWRAHTAEFGALLGQHILLVALSTAIAIVAGVPIGILAARRPRLGAPIVWLANIVQTIPSLAMFGFLLPLPLVGGLGARVAIFVLILYALLPIIRTTTAGLGSLDRVIVEAGTAMGMTPWQLLREVQLPLALPSIVAGIRVAAVIGVGTATIAAAIGAGGLGEYIFRGLSMVDPTVILAGAIPSALLALSIDGALTLLEQTLKKGGRRTTPVLIGLVVAAGAGGRRRLRDAVHRRQGWRDPGRVEELHRTGTAGRNPGADDRVADVAAGRAAPEPGRHLHLRPCDPIGRHRCLCRILRDGADGHLPRSPVDTDRQRVFDAIRRRYADAGLTLMDPLGFENTFAMLVRGDDARRLGLRTLSDLAAHAGALRAGFGYEFLQRQDGFPGLARAYGLRFAAPPTAMDLSLIYRALAEHQVDLIAGDATSGLIQAYGFAMLEDDRHYFPPVRCRAGDPQRRPARASRSARRAGAPRGQNHPR